MRTTIAIAVALMLVVAGCSQAPGTSPTTAGNPTDAQPLEDPSSDVLGWEQGYWYNETIAVTPNDGMNATELNESVARSMARVEQLRGLEFQSKVPVRIQTREEFSEQQRNQSVPAKRRTFDNAKFEALFMINESTDSLGVQNSNSGSSVGGFYSPSKNSIVVISNAENASTPTLDELTLGHELTHALQDQHFNLSTFNQTTRELHNAKDGLIEGDANYVQHLYSQRCKGAWNGSCSIPTRSSGSSGQLANMGPYLLKYQPYSDGPAFVRGVRRQGGWEAVNRIYENSPASTEQIIHPKKYGEDAPAEFRVRNRNSGNWKRLQLKGRPNYASVGEAGIFSMFMYPHYETQGKTQLIPARQFFNINRSTGKLASFDPLNYNASYSEGWDGDKLAVYVNDGAKENETGYVWKTRWDTRKDAREFATGYRKMLQYRNATKVDGRANTWRIPQGKEFADALYVKQTGKTVVIVNAPRVAGLSKIRKSAAPKR